MYIHTNMMVYATLKIYGRRKTGRASNRSKLLQRKNESVCMSDSIVIVMCVLHSVIVQRLLLVDRQFCVAATFLQNIHPKLIFTASIGNSDRGKPKVIDFCSISWRKKSTVRLIFLIMVCIRFDWLLNLWYKKNVPLFARDARAACKVKWAPILPTSKNAILFNVNSHVCVLYSLLCAQQSHTYTHKLHIELFKYRDTLVSNQKKTEKTNCANNIMIRFCSDYWIKIIVCGPVCLVRVK